MEHKNVDKFKRRLYKWLPNTNPDDKEEMLAAAAVYYFVFHDILDSVLAKQEEYGGKDFLHDMLDKMFYRLEGFDISGKGERFEDTHNYQRLIDIMF